MVDPVTSVFSDKHLCIGITGINNKWFPLLDHCCMCGSLTRQQWLITLISLMKHGYFSLATLIILKMQASKPSCELFKDRWQHMYECIRTAQWWNASHEDVHSPLHLRPGLIPKGRNASPSYIYFQRKRTYFCRGVLHWSITSSILCGSS